jgi:glutathione synthase/RimK-type ligase-like ATP-grasp enzyme
MITAILLSLGARFVNSPIAQASAVKPWQLTLAARLGLTIPDTLVSNAPADVLDFVQRHQSVIHKTITSPIARFFQTERWTPEHGQIISELPVAPVIFQSEICDALDVRVTIVGSQLFAVAFDGRNESNVDSRINLDVPYEVHSLSKEIEGDLLRMMTSLGLDFGTVDLKLKGIDYIFLEVNPQGQFLYVEVLTGMPIAAAVADLLISMSS